MANNRLFLICKQCKRGILLATHMGGAWSTFTSSKTIEDHEDCFYLYMHEHSKPDTLHSFKETDELFTIRYELTMTPEEWKDAIQ